MKIKEIQQYNKEYYVVAENGSMFAGLEKGDVVWTNKTLLAKPLYDLRQFKFFERFYPELKCKVCFL